jgi:NAD(P)H-hydrate epimerase
MGRLCGKTTAEIQSDRLSAALELTKEYENLTVVLKGAGTIIAKQGRINVNPNGNPGMAKGGSGDVLAGIISSLKAQKISSFDSAASGCWLHGSAGNLARIKLSMQSMTATDIIRFLPGTFKIWLA